MNIRTQPSLAKIDTLEYGLKYELHKYLSTSAHIIASNSGTSSTSSITIKSDLL